MIRKRVRSKLRLRGVASNHKNLLLKLAWEASKKCSIDFEDLYTEAYFAYCYALQTHKQKKQTILSTFIYIVVRNQLDNIVQKDRREKRRLDLSADACIDRPGTEPSPIRSYEVKEQLEGLSQCAKEIWGCIIDSPWDFLVLPKRRRITKMSRIIKRRLPHHNTFSIRNGIKELKSLARKGEA